MTFDDGRDDNGSGSRPTTKRTIRVPDPSKISDAKRIVGEEFSLPPSYPDPLREFVDVYRSTDKLPKTDFDKLSAMPKDQFRMFPAKYRRAISYASSNALLVFWSLWGQHEDRHSRANGVLSGSIEWLMKRTGLGYRNAISDAILELEVRGIVRIQRGRAGRGRKHTNLFLLTAFPDCLGNKPTLDYETCGLPQEKPTANSDESREAESDIIAERFERRIRATMELVRWARQHRGEVV